MIDSLIEDYAKEIVKNAKLTSALRIAREALAIANDKLIPWGASFVKINEPITKHDNPQIEFAIQQIDDVLADTDVLGADTTPTKDRSEN